MVFNPFYLLQILILDVKYHRTATSQRGTWYTEKLLLLFLINNTPLISALGRQRWEAL